MIEILVVTLGKHGASLIDAGQRIIGGSSHLHSLTLEWHEGLDAMTKRLDDTLASFEHAEGVLLLTDIFGSTATNIALDKASPGKVEVVTGVNLPMIIKATTLADSVTVAQAANMVCNQGRKAIRIAGEML